MRYSLFMMPTLSSWVSPSGEMPAASCRVWMAFALYTPKMVLLRMPTRATASRQYKTMVFFFSATILYSFISCDVELGSSYVV